MNKRDFLKQKKWSVPETFIESFNRHSLRSNFKTINSTMECAHQYELKRVTLLER